MWKSWLSAASLHGCKCLLILQSGLLPCLFRVWGAKEVYRRYRESIWGFSSVHISRRGNNRHILVGCFIVHPSRLESRADHTKPHPDVTVTFSTFGVSQSQSFKFYLAPPHTSCLRPYGNLGAFFDVAVLGRSDSTMRLPREQPACLCRRSPSSGNALGFPRRAW